ncbi:MAG: DUF488 family protein [Verrucomicrobiota bacterium]|nr:DUF488 family protein [Verrucomicrobiota bacterium]
MALRVVRLGEPRVKGEGMRLGSVRRPPRGVAKSDFAKRNFYDLWLPELAPSAELVKTVVGKSLTEKEWAKFTQRYRREMSQAGAHRLLQLLALMSQQTNFSVGCYCADEARCHRSILRELLRAAGGKIVR